MGEFRGLNVLRNQRPPVSPTPPEATAVDVQALADVGLNELEVLDLILSSAIFGWASRLMHTLGEPIMD
jgi:alkylhydroperoxidase family enzyme